MNCAKFCNIIFLAKYCMQLNAKNSFVENLKFEYNNKPLEYQGFFFILQINILA